MAEKWKVIGHDYGSFLFRNFIAVRGYNNFKKEVGIHSSGFGIAAKKGDIKYLFKSSQFKRSHEELRAKVEKNIHMINELIEKVNKLGEEAVRCSEQLFNSDLRAMPGQDLIKKIKEIVLMQSRLYTLGVLLPVLDFQHNKFIENNLRSILKKSRKPNEYFQTLTLPSEDSFGMLQEKDLLRLMVKHEDKILWNLVINDKGLEIIQNQFRDFYTDLEAHARKYCWVYYVYSGPAYTENDFLEFVKDYLRKGKKPLHELDRLDREKKALIQEKKRIINELKPDEYDKEIMKLAGHIIWAKPHRKDYQSRIYYNLIEGPLREVARRLMISRNQVLSCPLDYMGEALEAGEIDVDLLNSIYKYHLVFLEGDDIKIYHGEKAKKAAQEIEKKAVDYDIDELKGTSACPGKAKGIVRIINKPTDMVKMNYGDILISTATTPSIVSAMKKASAIVTDEGGITCHASIVSRELKIPCVVGTGIATRVFKDGDQAEVDADKGVIRRIK